jgi:hypothetical protein
MLFCGRKSLVTTLVGCITSARQKEPEPIRKGSLLNLRQKSKNMFLKLEKMTGKAYFDGFNYICSIFESVNIAVHLNINKMLLLNTAYKLLSSLLLLFQISY